MSGLSRFGHRRHQAIAFAVEKGHGGGRRQQLHAESILAEFDQAFQGVDSDRHPADLG
jgi:hypothetical protein